MTSGSGIVTGRATGIGGGTRVDEGRNLPPVPQDGQPRVRMRESHLARLAPSRSPLSQGQAEKQLLDRLAVREGCALQEPIGPEKVRHCGIDLARCPAASLRLQSPDEPSLVRAKVPIQRVTATGHQYANLEEVPGQPDDEPYGGLPGIQELRKVVQGLGEAFLADPVEPAPSIDARDVPADCLDVFAVYPLPFADVRSQLLNLHGEDPELRTDGGCECASGVQVHFQPVVGRSVLNDPCGKVGRVRSRKIHRERSGAQTVVELGFAPGGNACHDDQDDPWRRSGQRALYGFPGFRCQSLRVADDHHTVVGHHRRGRHQGRDRLGGSVATADLVEIEIAGRRIEEEVGNLADRPFTEVFLVTRKEYDGRRGSLAESPQEFG
jgi:hypothetical protein